MEENREKMIIELQSLREEKQIKLQEKTALEEELKTQEEQIER